MNIYKANVFLALYVLSGVFQPILIEVLNYSGAAEKSTMLFILPSYVAMALAPLSNRAVFKKKITILKYIVGICLTDIASNYLNFTGLINAGSGIYTVLYSSVVVYTAMMSYFVLARNLHIAQWIGIFTMVAGLMLSGIQGLAGGNMLDPTSDEALGVLQIFAGTLLHSLLYLFSEIVIVNVDEVDQIAPEMLSFCIGIGGVIFFGIWQFIYTIPNYETLVVENIKSKNGDILIIVSTYIVLTMVNYIHCICFFNILGHFGATTTGVLKGVQTVLVFGLSHIAFCKIQASQCFSNVKLLSLIIVLIGVTFYSLFESKKQKAENKQFMKTSSMANLPFAMMREDNKNVTTNKLDNCETRIVYYQLSEGREEIL